MHFDFWLQINEISIEIRSCDRETISYSKCLVLVSRELYYVNFFIRCAHNHTITHTLSRYNEIIQQFMASIEHLKVIDCMSINRRSCLPYCCCKVKYHDDIFVLKFADCFIYIYSAHIKRCCPTTLRLNYFRHSMCLFHWSFVCFGSPPNIIYIMMIVDLLLLLFSSTHGFEFCVLLNNAFSVQLQKVEFLLNSESIQSLCSIKYLHYFNEFH